jgi:hypothetical protein
MMIRFVCISMFSCLLLASVGRAAGPAGESKQGAEQKVLRHAVFFKFKDTATKADVDGVVSAFRALPGKIHQIKDFEHGTNNSKEGRDDGFTHCFLLTFADEAGRTVYLPHPDHKAFGAVLRPHLEKVFVIDYWGDARRSDERELRHAVFFKFKSGAAAADVEKVEKAFEALPEKIKAIKAFEWGKNNSPEKHHAGFTHAILVTFDSEAARDEYLEHPAHEAFVEVALPSIEKVRVMDFWSREEGEN